mmetsp:Transcript_20317/g.39855  ORF Transcript_20317/g.39855 Transcript_20317/m.39855 type:complete len:401 (+) Transcript_20317:1249-2451(+)
MVVNETTGARKKAAEGVLSVNTSLVGPSKNRTVFLEELIRKLVASGNTDHLLNKINARDKFGDRVLDLKTGVHLQEVKVAVLIAEELDSTGTLVVDSLCKLDGFSLHSLASFRVEKGTRTLLKHLLVTALNTALTLREGSNVAVRIGNELDLDVSGLLDKLLNEDTVITKGGTCLLRGETETLNGLGIVPCDTHTLTTTTSTGLDHDRVANLVGNLLDLRICLYNCETARNSADTSIDGELLGLDLITHGSDSMGTRANECDSIGLKDLGKVVVLREKAVARVHSLGSSLLDDLEDLVHIKVGLSRSSRSHTVCLVSHFHVHGVLIGLRIDGNGLNAELTGSLDYTAGNLTTVGNENLVKELLTVYGHHAAGEHVLGVAASSAHLLRSDAVNTGTARVSS